MRGLRRLPALVDSWFDLLPANQDLTAAEVRLMPAPGREMRLKQLLAAEAWKQPLAAVEKTE